MKIIHLITGLSTGGAEIMLYKLLSCLDFREFESWVFSITEIGPVGKKIEDLGIQVRALRAKREIPDPRFFFKLVRYLNEIKPDIIHTWMYHANLIGGIAAKIVGKSSLIWSIHHGFLDLENDKWSTIWTAKLGAILSSYSPMKIICCSEASKRAHEILGYHKNKMVIIPNGFDLEYFFPNLLMRKIIRDKLGFNAKSILIGLVARFHPHKDILTFCKAVKIFNRIYPDVHFLLCGNGLTPENSFLTKKLDELKIRSVVHLLGYREDICAILNGLDIATLSSKSEAFPIFIGEAMASGVPCVATEVGDIARIIGETGFIVPPGNPELLSSAWKAMVDLGADQRKQLGEKARLRIKENFSLESFVKQYCNLYKSIIN